MHKRHGLVATQALPPSVTLYSAADLETAIPPTLLTNADAVTFYMPTLPPSRKLHSALLKAAGMHEAALIPATTTEIERELLTLSAATIQWVQADQETELQFELVKAGLSDVPLDILKDGCRAYMMTPGKRYFPRSPGELREFTSPALLKRTRRLHNLRRIAAELGRQIADAEARAAAETSWTQESIDEANAIFERTGVKTRYRLIDGGRAETFTLTAEAA